jgi:hypothetical protein
MLIACLGWGSLVWDPRDLPVRGGNWFKDGPFLPIEFARQSSDGRITLVLMPATFPCVRSLWKPMSVLNLKSARKALGMRECAGRTRPETCVDYWPRGRRNTFVIQEIGRWARRLQVDAVVWTNLPPKFNDENKRIPTTEDVLSYLGRLHGRERKNAKRYVCMTPQQIDTDYRRAIKRALRWGCLSPI